MKNTYRFSIAVVAAFCCYVAPALAQRGGALVYVDDSALPGGDGTAEHPVQTIQEGIALLPKRGGTVLIYPGTYVGPMLIERDDVVLWGLTDPIYDTEGYLVGFTSTDPFDEEVVVTIDRPLENEDISIGKQPEDLIELRGSRNEVHNLVIDMLGQPSPGDFNNTSAFSAKAEDGDFYDGIVFSHIVVRGSVKTVGWSRKTNAVFEFITSLDSGFNGISATGNGDVEVRNVHLARKSVAVLYLSLWEYPKGENGPSLLTGALQYSKLRNGNGNIGFWRGVGLVVMGRASRTNPAESVTIGLDVTGNVFEDDRPGVMMIPTRGQGGITAAETLIDLRFHDNLYSRNRVANAIVTFQPEPPEPGVDVYVLNSIVTVDDGDGVFPLPTEVDVGPEENGNTYVLIQD